MSLVEAAGAAPSAPKAPAEPRLRGSWTARRHLIMGYVALAVLVGGFGGWAIFSNIAGAVITSGRLEVESNRQVVQHVDGGIVTDIFAKEGDTVKAGDVLFRLDGTILQSELSIVETQLFEMMARRARLEAERDGAAQVVFEDELLQAAENRPDVREQVDGQARLFDARRSTLARQLEQLGEQRNQIVSQITGIDAQIAAMKTQVDLIAKELADQQTLLQKGLAESSRVSALEREKARLEGVSGELIASRGQSEERISEIEIERLRLEASYREEASTQLRDIGSQELELAERRRALVEQMARLEVKAPVSGIVLGVQVNTPQAVVRPADPMLYIVPQDRPLVIASQVSVIDVDQVHPGQEVELVFSAFSSRTTPHLKGHVVSVSPDAFTDQNSGMSFYRAEIELDPGEREKLEGLTLIPGMPVEAFIKTEERSPMSYMLKPFTDYFSHAFRET